MMRSTASRSQILLKPRRPNFELSASTITFWAAFIIATVQRRFEHVGRRESEFQIDAVHAHEQLAAIEVAEHLLGKRPNDRHRTAAGDAAELNHVDVGVLRKDRSDGHRRRNDGQVAYGLYFTRQKRHGGSRRDDDRIVLRDQAGGLGADGPLLRDVLFFSFSLTWRSLI